MERRESASLDSIGPLEELGRGDNPRSLAEDFSSCSIDFVDGDSGHARVLFSPGWLGASGLGGGLSPCGG